MAATQPVMPSVPTFSVRGWNTDTVNDHTITVYITVLPSDPPPTGLLEQFPKLAQFLDALRGE